MLTQVTSGMTDTNAQYYGFKSRIINGGMGIDQRNNGGSVGNPVGATYTLDRWLAAGFASSKYTIQQTPSATETGYATRVAAGFTNYLAVTSSSAYSVPSGEYYVINQYIEGFNTADLAFGTANAKTITLSFLAYSSLTGTFGGALRNSGDNRSYPFTYTISSANTWTQISITIPGDTSGTWIGATNGVGLRVCFSLGTGSTYSGTAGSWSSNNYSSATGATSVVGTNGATFYLTGVQIEKGTQATSFDYRPYGTELALCQRYYQSINFSEAQGSYTKFGNGVAYSTIGARVNVFLLVKMRTYPSLVVTSTASNYGLYTTSDLACNSVPTINSNSNPSVATIEMSVASGLSAGNIVLAQANNNQSAYVGFSAEL